MMRVLAPQQIDVERYPRFRREGAPELGRERGVELADPGLPGRNRSIEMDERPSRYIHNRPDQRLIQRDSGVGVSNDTPLVAERLENGAAKHDPYILDGVVSVDMKIPDAANLQAEATMPGQRLKHVIEETDPGRNLGRAGCVEIHGCGDLGFASLPGAFRAS